MATRAYKVYAASKEKGVCQAHKEHKAYQGQRESKENRVYRVAAASRENKAYKGCRASEGSRACLGRMRSCQICCPMCSTRWTI